MNKKIATLIHILNTLKNGNIRGKMSLFLCILAILYLIVPIDVIPDALIGPGQIDDLLLLLGAITNSFLAYKKIKAEKQNPRHKP